MTKQTPVDNTRALLKKGIVPTRKLAAQFLGVTPPAISLWTKEEWFQPEWKTRIGREDCYNVLAIAAARNAEGRKGSQDDDESRKQAAEKNRQRARRERLLADKLERENEIELSKLLPLEDWELFATETITAARDRLLRLPKDFKRQLCRKCQPRTMELTENLLAILEALAKLKSGP